jgi:hypothetical protein
MKPDLYTKFVLTIIALLLLLIACNQYINPVTTASAQGPFAGVQVYFDTAGSGFIALDTRTGDYWEYAANGGHVPFAQTLRMKGKLTKLGEPSMPYLICDASDGSHCVDKPVR